MSRTDPSQKGLSGTDPKQLLEKNEKNKPLMILYVYTKSHTYGTRVAVRLVCCSADAVGRAWNVSKCVLLGRALADFRAWWLFAVMHALYTCRFFLVFVTHQY